MNPTTKLHSHFFFALLIGVLILTFFIFKPYVSALVLALVTGIIFEPLHTWVMTKMPKRRSIGALVTLCIVVIAVLTPISLIATKVLFELRDLYVSVAYEGGTIGLIDTLGATIQSASAKIPFLGPLELEAIQVSEYFKQGLRWSLENADTLFSGAAKFALSAFIFLIALYYVIRDGGALKNAIVKFSPLLDIYDEEIFLKLKRAVNSVIRGSLIIGVIQGILTGIGFAIFGVPNPVLWGTLASITALIPGVGTSLVLIPGILYLLVLGSMGPALGLLLWAIVAVGLIDNFLAPKLIEQGVKIHPFFILLSVIGGLALFGPLGFILGPLTLAFLFALLDIYRVKVMQGSKI